MYMMRQRIQSFGLRNEGASLIELALVTPLLLLLLVGAIDFGRAYYTAIELDTAAQAGAQYGAQNPLDIDGITNVVQLNATDIQMDAPTVTNGCECYDGTNNTPNTDMKNDAPCNTIGDPDPCATAPPAGGQAIPTNMVHWVDVKTTATYRPLFPYPGIPSSIPLQAQAVMRASY